MKKYPPEEWAKRVVQKSPWGHNKHPGFDSLGVCREIEGEGLETWREVSLLGGVKME